MGSGSSKCRRRTFNVNSIQPLSPTELSPGNSPDKEKATCKLEYDDKPKGAGRRISTRDTEIEEDTFIPMDTDQDMKLLDELLVESQDYLSWQDSTFKEQAFGSRCHHANSSPLSLLQVQGEWKHNPEILWTEQKQSEVQPASDECDNIQYRQQVMSGNCKKMVLSSKSTEDIENNNLPYQLQSSHQNMAEERPSVIYDDSEEALMESIEQQYSQ